MFQLFFRRPLLIILQTKPAKYLGFYYGFNLNRFLDEKVSKNSMLY